MTLLRTHIDVVPSGAALGAEVRGIDLVHGHASFAAIYKRGSIIRRAVPRPEAV